MKFLAPPLRILALLGVAFFVIVMLQDRLLYFPERATLADLLPPAARGVAPWPATGEFRGLLVEPPGGMAHGTVVVFHGNAGHAGHRTFYAEALAPLGWRVLLAEYPGYGPREGAPGEAVLVADAVATLALARQRFGPLVVLGESLGAGVAAAAAARVDEETLAGQLLVTPWDSLPAVAAHHYPWLPRRLLDHALQDRYDSVAHLRGSRLPVTVVVAADDDIVPAAHGRRLFEALGSGRRLLEIARAGHNDWPDRVDAVWWRELMAPFARPATASVD